MINSIEMDKHEIVANNRKRWKKRLCIFGFE